MHDPFLTKVQKQFKGRMVAFMKNDVGVSRHPQAKNKQKKHFNLNLIPYKKKKLTQNGSWT